MQIAVIYNNLAVDPPEYSVPPAFDDTGFLYGWNVTHGTLFKEIDNYIKDKLKQRDEKIVRRDL